MVKSKLLSSEVHPGKAKAKKSDPFDQVINLTKYQVEAIASGFNIAQSEDKTIKYMIAQPNGDKLQIIYLNKKQRDYIKEGLDKIKKEKME